jgi:hypothetical protein
LASAPPPTAVSSYWRPEGVVIIDVLLSKKSNRLF